MKMKRDIQVRQADGNTIDAGGFSVIELLIVMAIAAILMALGMPSFVDFTRDIRAGSMMGTLTADIQSARSESVKRNARILFCARATPTSTSCTAAPAAAAWMNGWLVCYDRDSDGACDASTAAEPNPIRVQGAIQAPLAIAGPAVNLVMFPTGSTSAGSVFTVTGGTAVTRTATIQPSGSVVTAKSGGY
jgi:type IV fimbrial biogenesis protein FimT